MMARKIWFVPLLCAIMLFSGCASESETLVSSPPEESGAQGYETAEENMVIVSCNGMSAELTLATGEAAQALYARLREGALVITGSDYGGFEKVCALGFFLPDSDEWIRTQPGDVMLYQGNRIVFFYGSNSWAYTRLGYIDASEQELRRLLCAGEDMAEITLCLKV